MRLSFFSSPKFGVSRFYVVSSITPFKFSHEYVTFVFTIEMLVTVYTLRDYISNYQSFERLPQTQGQCFVNYYHKARMLKSDA